MMSDRNLHRRMWAWPIVWAVAAATAVVCLGCSGKDTDAMDAYVGDLSDDSYAGWRGHSTGVNVHGRRVSLADFQGRFLWVDYAAPWCGPCAPQARQVAALEKSLGDRVVFLTVLTSDHKPFSAATRGTAKMWSSQFGLDPKRVVAGSGRGGMVIPQHFLFSPTGQLLYRHKGLLYADHMRGTFLDQRAKWTREEESYPLQF